MGSGTVGAMGSESPPSELDDLVERVTHLAENAAKVALGLGILGINRVQALRRDLAAKLADSDQR